MAVTAFWYAKAFLAAFNAEIDFDNGIKVALTLNAYTPNQDTHDYFNDVTNEIADTGYTAGGFSLVNPTKATATNVLTLDSDDPSWTSGNPATFTARRAVYYDSTPGTAATNPLLIWVDFGADQVAQNGGVFTIQHAGTGIGTVTASDAAGFP